MVPRPPLRDPNDEMVLEAAVNGRADALVTFNVRDYGTTPAQGSPPARGDSEDQTMKETGCRGRSKRQ
jgi:hypothetical protein